MAAVSSSDGAEELRVGVLALQGDYDAHATRLHQLGCEPVLVRLPSQLHSLDGLVIPGGESTTFLKFLERDGFLDVLREFVAARPTFGTCAGCILLASRITGPEQKGLGALHATVARNAYARQNDSTVITSQTSLPGGPLEMVFIRAPRIEQVADGIKVLAERDGSPTLVQDGHILAATFHPELSDDARVHEHFVEMVRTFRQQKTH